MKYNYSYEVRPGQRVNAHGTIPQPTERDVQDLAKTISFLALRKDFKLEITNADSQ